MADVVLLDSDVILDVLAHRDPFYDDSVAVVAACEAGRCYGLVAAPAILTLYALVAEHRGPTAAHSVLRDLLRIVEVAPIDGTVLEQVLGDPSTSFDDGLLIAAAEVAGAGRIITRAPARLAHGPVPALTPGEFLPLLGTP